MKKFPKHGWIGLVFVAVFWWVNWTFEGLRTHWAFTPLWVGYALAVDGFVYKRKGNSLLTRNWKAYLGLFAVSVAGWWTFEVLNWRVHNWSYMGREYFSYLEYGLLASFSFSTVVPAVFGTAELVSTAKWLRELKPGWQLRANRRNAIFYFAAGWVMLGLMLLWPRYFFPFLWLSVYFILEPINLWFGFRTLAARVNQGDWRPVIALWLGALICGFFWRCGISIRIPNGFTTSPLWTSGIFSRCQF